MGAMYSSMCTYLCGEIEKNNTHRKTLYSLPSITEYNLQYDLWYLINDMDKKVKNKKNI